MRASAALLAAAFAGVLSGAVAPPVALARRASAAKAAIEEFNRTPRSVRAEHPMLRTMHLPAGNGRCSYAVSVLVANLARDHRLFRVAKMEPGGKDIVLQLETSGLDPGEYLNLRIALAGGATAEDAVPLVLAELFDFRTPPRSHGFVGCRTGARRVHLSSCNHLPPAEVAVPFATVEEALQQGYSECAVCFARVGRIPIPTYPAYRAAALSDGRLYERLTGLAGGDSLQRRVQQFGDSLVALLPVTPLGYEYRFRIVHSEIPSIRCLPTGFVYVTDSLYDSLDDRWELAFLLAHEITHVERHLPWFWMPLEADADYRRWRRNQEIEADLVALLCLASLGAPPDAGRNAANVLRKLQPSSSGTAPMLDMGTHEWMPAMEERLEWLEESDFSYPVATGVVLAADGAATVRVHLAAAVIQNDDWVLLVSIAPTLGFTSSFRVDSVELRTPAGEWKAFEVEGAQGVLPGHPRIVRARAHKSDTFDLRSLGAGCVRLVTTPQVRSTCAEQ